MLYIKVYSAISHNVIYSRKEYKMLISLKVYTLMSTNMTRYDLRREIWWNISNQAIQQQTEVGICGNKYYVFALWERKVPYSLLPSLLRDQSVGTYFIIYTYRGKYRGKYNKSSPILYIARCLYLCILNTYAQRAHQIAQYPYIVEIFVYIPGRF